MVNVAIGERYLASTPAARSVDCQLAFQLGHMYGEPVSAYSGANRRIAFVCTSSLCLDFDSFLRHIPLSSCAVVTFSARSRPLCTLACTRSRAQSTLAFACDKVEWCCMLSGSTLIADHCECSRLHRRQTQQQWHVLGAGVNGEEVEIHVEWMGVCDVYGSMV